jgi:serpin B
MRWPLVAKPGVAVDLPEKIPSPSIRFAFKLFRQLASEQNLFFSPASVMFCLALLYEGATGKTRESIAKVLEIAGLDSEAQQLAITALKSCLHVYGPRLQLETANSLWCNHECVPRSEYVAKVREDYDAEVTLLDLRGAEAVARINSWVSGKTRGKIGNILSRIDPLTSLLVINAIYFKDFWGNPFKRELTREGLFHTSEGRTLKVPFMSQSSSCPYYEESKFQAVRLGYTSHLGMYIFLPTKRSNLLEFQQNLTSAIWDTWVARFETREGQLCLPRFKLTYSVNLNSTLDKLGMGIAFDPQQARFDTINPAPPAIWISQILHRALVEVNEEGTEAAAATGMVAFLTVFRPRTFEMIVDRPFFFVISDDYSKWILFMGSVDEPHSDFTD